MNYDLKIFTENIGPRALNQVYTLMEQSTFYEQKVRIMPDVHRGIGAVVGFTSTMGDKIIPNVIGVDIGCGMLTVRLGKIDVDYESLDRFIKENIPAGRAYCREENGQSIINALYVKNELTNMPRLLGSIGSLGGGNHFIEVDVGEDGEKYLVIHTGSRNLGMQVASIYQKMAVDDCKNAAVIARDRVIQELKENNRTEKIPEAIEEVNQLYAYRSKIPPQLCYLDGAHCSAYMHDMLLCAEFAVMNRGRIAEKIKRFLGVDRAEEFETIHNYIDSNNIVRKGAIAARANQKVLIPMNMRDGCILGVGKGNADWNFSAPHGAGRLFSRSDAKKLFSEEEFKREMEGIFTTTADKSTIDEAPMAYKPADEIKSLIAPTVDIIEVIKPVYNFKAAE